MIKKTLYLLCIIALLMIIFIVGLVDTKFNLIFISMVLILIMFLILILQNKRMKLFIKIIFSTIIILFLCWSFIINIDMQKMNKLEKPVFAKLNEEKDDIVTYSGIGYKVMYQYNVKTDSLQSGTFYLFNKVIGGINI